MKNLLTLFFLFCYVYNGFSQSNDVLAKSYFLKAQENYSEGNNASALENLDKTLEYLSSTNAKIESLYVKIFVTKQNFSEAKKHITLYFEKADNSRSDYIDMLRYLTEINEQLEEESRRDILFNKVENREYPTIRMGDQIWLAENLNTNKFQNGVPIREVNSFQEWQEALKNKTPAWCYYDFNKLYENQGKLYNYYAMKDSRRIAPKGWRVPAFRDWEQLVAYLGEDNVDSKIKDNKKWGLKSAKNETGFNAIPGGRFYNEIIGGYEMGPMGINEYAEWWSTTTCFEVADHCIQTFAILDEVVNLNSSGNSTYGYHIRLIKENSEDDQLKFTENDKILNYNYIGVLNDSMEITDRKFLDGYISISKTHIHIESSILETENTILNIDFDLVFYIKSISTYEIENGTGIKYNCLLNNKNYTLQYEKDNVNGEIFFISSQDKKSLKRSRLLYLIQ